MYVSLSDVVILSEIGLKKQKTYKEMLSILQYIFSKSNLCWASDAKPIHSFKNWSWIVSTKIILTIEYETS